MLIKKSEDIRSSEITPQSTYLNRRNFLAMSEGAAAVGAAAVAGLRMKEPEQTAHAATLTFTKSPLSTSDKPNLLKDIASYNNFYEFGTDKSDPAANAHT